MLARHKFNSKMAQIIQAVISLCVIFSTCFVGCQKHVKKTLPQIEDLEELELFQVADFTKSNEIASPAIPVISPENETFFFDYRLKQLFKSNLYNQKIIPIGHFGEGPGEYMRIIGLLLENKELYVLDAHRKIICMDTAGNLIWEEKFVPNFNGILGKRGEAFYFTEIRMLESDQFMLGLTEWIRSKESRLLCEKPILTYQGNAIVDGKVVEGGGFFFLANPAYAITRNILAVSASNKYEFDILDLDGNTIHTHTLKAPAPYLTGIMKRLKSSENLKNYAIAKIMSLNDELLIVSNYYLEGKPRIDRFSLSGDLISSHILPLEFNPPSKDVVIQGEYIVYIDRDYAGFLVFQFSN